MANKKFYSYTFTKRNNSVPESQIEEWINNGIEELKTVGETIATSTGCAKVIMSRVMEDGIEKIIVTIIRDGYEKRIYPI